jgi:hypothetical protein
MRQYLEDLQPCEKMFNPNTLTGKLPIEVLLCIAQGVVFAGFARYLHCFGVVQACQALIATISHQVGRGSQLRQRVGTEREVMLPACGAINGEDAPTFHPLLKEL